jgi:hypothetical protein
MPKELLTEAFWARIAPLLPPEPKPKGGRPRVSDRGRTGSVQIATKTTPAIQPHLPFIYSITIHNLNICPQSSERRQDDNELKGEGHGTSRMNETMAPQSRVGSPLTVSGGFSLEAGLAPAGPWSYRTVSRHQPAGASSPS